MDFVIIIKMHYKLKEMATEQEEALVEKVRPVLSRRDIEIGTISIRQKRESLANSHGPIFSHAFRIQTPENCPCVLNGSYRCQRCSDLTQIHLHPQISTTQRALSM
jgi:hypothetical protein